jgi:hypothetical protein
MKQFPLMTTMIVMAGATVWSAADQQTLREKIAGTNWAKVRGANYIPSYASNTYEIRRNYNHDVFDRELDLVSAVGYNSVRLWLNYAAFDELGRKMTDNVEDGLRLCAKYRLRAVINLFDACGVHPRKDARWVTASEAYNVLQESPRFTAEQKSLMKRLFATYARGFGARTLVPLAADSPMTVLLFQSWQSTPGSDRLAPAFYPKLERYVGNVMDRLRNNSAVLLWDVMNEPEFAGEGPISPSVFMTAEMEQTRDSFLKHFHDFIKRKYPDEITSVGWARLDNTAKYADFADVMTFHIYGEPTQLQTAIDRAVDVSKKAGKKILITETLANWDFGSPDFGSLASDEKQLAHYQKILPVLTNSPIGWIAWGMIVNRTFDPYTDIFYPNGQPRPAAVYLEKTLKEATR